MMPKKTHSGTHRDYGREALADPDNSALIKSAQLCCVLDESTCLTCLELDGSQTPPALPIHLGCRCVTLPATKTFRELGIDLPEFPEGSRASAIGPVPRDGGLYKQYLIQRARLAAKGSPVADGATELADWLKSASDDTSDDGVIACIRLAIYAMSPPKTFDELRPILAMVRWNAIDRYQFVFQLAAEAEEYDLLVASLERCASDVPDGPYAGRHRGMLYRSVAQAIEPICSGKAIDFLVRAANHDPLNVALLVQLGALQRRAGQNEQARVTIEKALAIGPTHKGAFRELKRLSEEPKAREEH